jgi:hypothetical protein
MNSGATARTMSTDINRIAQDGFSLGDQDHKLKNLAMISLKIALQAYFSTYKSMLYSLHLFDGIQKQHDQKTIDSNHNGEYCQNCAETILHFQHFAELVCKDFLRAEHGLLAIDASQKPLILHKLIKKETVSEQELDGINTLEFGEALTRLCALIKDGRIGVGRLEFILDGQHFLERLNWLRNREWHRGAYILRYPALDRLVGEHILPFVNKVTALPEYTGLSHFWKYKALSCTIDPIDVIMGTCKAGKFDLGKIALLKELGRAAYFNPLFSVDMLGQHFNEEHVRRAQHLAKGELESGTGSDVKSCPVCGIKSLVVYEDTDFDEEKAEAGVSVYAWRYTYQVKCMCCTFEINHRLENPSKYGLALEDYWQAEEL